jgi:hypothetical protein
VFLLAGCDPNPAFAQTAAAPSSTVVSFGGLFNDYLLPAVLTAVSVIVTWGVRKLDKFFGSRLSDETRTALEQSINRGLHWAADKLATQVNNKKLTDIDVKNAVVAGALNYVTYYSPDAMKFFGVTKDTLQARVEAQLAEILGMGTIAEVAAGPALPPPVAPPPAAITNVPMAPAVPAA